MEHKEIEGVHFVTEQEGRDIFDANALRLFGMSGYEWAWSYYMGCFDAELEADQDSRYIQMWMMLPLWERLAE